MIQSLIQMDGLPAISLITLLLFNLLLNAVVVSWKGLIKPNELPSAQSLSLSETIQFVSNAWQFIANKPQFIHRVSFLRTELGPPNNSRPRCAKHSRRQRPILQSLYSGCQVTQSATTSTSRRWVAVTLHWLQCTKGLKVYTNGSNVYMAYSSGNAALPTQGGTDLPIYSTTRPIPLSTYPPDPLSAPPLSYPY